MKKRSLVIAWGLLLGTLPVIAQSDYQAMVARKANALEDQVIDWRHHIHQNPELSNREYETAEYVTKHLRSLGLEVETEIAHTGVKAVLRTGKPGPTVALRADMDALPVRERTPVDFASTKTTTYLGEEVGVMHACGHDTHVAMLMGAAQILTEMKDELRGNIVFIFQPAEEGAPPGEEGGADMMVKEGVLKNPDVDAIFGLHINSQTEVGKVRYKPGGALAAADRFEIKIMGEQTHGSQPWGGVDPITVSAQVIQGLQHIISRQVELTKEAAVISVGKIQGGVRNNIIPEEVNLIGTIRTLDTAMQRQIHERMRRTAENIAASFGATAEVFISDGIPVTYNDPGLTQKMLPTIEATAGPQNTILSKAITGAEDFSYYAEEVPGLFLFVGGMPVGTDPAEAAPHHTPDFYIDDSGMKLGVKMLCNLAVGYLNQ